MAPDATDASLGLRLQPDPTRWTLPRFLADVAARHGPRPALVFEGRTWSYGALAAEVRGLARGLLACGTGKGTHVGLLLANRPEWVVACFAVASVGAVAVPISTLATREERDWILRHANVSGLLLQRSLRSRDFLEEMVEAHPEIASSDPGRVFCPALPQLRRIAVTGREGRGGGVARWDDLLARGEEVPDALLAAAADDVAPGDDALIVYTSGTTERPKGVVHRQRAPVIQAWRFAEWLGLAPDDRVFTAQPFFWSAGIAMSLGATLAAGASLVLQETFEPIRALELIEHERATVVHAFPHQEQALGEQAGAAEHALGALRKTRFSSPLAKLAGIEQDVWGIDASYGLSETFTLVSALPTDAPADLRRASSGRPLPGTEIAILDPESGAPAPAGTPGEIAVRGATLMRGYHRLPPEAAFDADGWFRTGDGGWLDAEGLLHWTGRLTGMVKTGGANVSPLEVERRLAGYPGLEIAAAIGVPHPTLGEALVLCVVPAAGAAPPDEAAIRAFLREHLAPYKVPRRVLVFARGEIALTQNQKLQLAPLREAARARLAAEGAEIAGHRY